MTHEEFCEATARKYVQTFALWEVKGKWENPKASYEDYMKADLKALSGCTHIAMLDGWECSNGAKREKAEAERIGIEIMFFREIRGLK